MHEMAIVTDILDAVCAHAEQAGAQKVVGLTLVAGEVRDIHEDLLQHYIDWFSRGTIAEGMKAKMIVQPLRFRCRECGEIYRYSLKQGAIMDESGAVLAGVGSTSDVVDLGEDECGCGGSRDHAGGGECDDGHDGHARGDEHAHGGGRRHVEKVRPHCLRHPDAGIDVTTGYELSVIDISVV